ncbi:MAG: thiamine-phosphate synthase family protein [Candidatus Odinarchaeia archaeon]
MSDEREYVLGRLIESVILIENSPEFSFLIPEVRVNLVFSLSNAKSKDDVAAVDGRITVVNNLPRASGLPKFGVSDHMARAILEIKKYEPEIRAGINFRYNQVISGIVDAYASEKSLFVGCIDRVKEPEDSAKGKVKSMPWKIKYLKDKYGEIPRFFYETAGWGKEPLFVIVGEDPVKITKDALEIAKRYSLTLKTNKK